jgi:hypothetical protein
MSLFSYQVKQINIGGVIGVLVPSAVAKIKLRVRYLRHLVARFSSSTNATTTTNAPTTSGVGLFV